jgi:hypothetical protein
MLDGKYVIRRAGTFIAKPSGHFHCGTGVDTFRYEIKVTVDGLDDSGFVVDQLKLNEICQTIDKSINESCELRANRITSAIADHFRSARMMYALKKIEVTIGPADNPDADVCFTCTEFARSHKQSQAVDDQERLVFANYVDKRLQNYDIR